MISQHPKEATTQDGRPESIWPLVRIVAVTALIFASMAIIPPTADDIVRQSFGLDNDSVGLYYKVHSLPNLLLLGIVVGVLSDRIRRRVPLALAGALGTGITTIAIPHVPSFEGLIALRVFDGITGIAALGMLMTRAIDLSAGKSRAGTLAIYLVAIPVGYLSGSFFVALLGTEHIATTFAITGGLLVLASLTLVLDLFKPEPISSRQPTLRQIADSLRAAPRLWFPYFFGFVDKFTFALLTMLSALALSDRYQLSAIVWGGSALGLLWVAYLLASWPAGVLSRRLGAWHTVALGSAGYGTALILLVAFDSPLAFIAAMMMAGAFVALQTIPTYMLLGEFSGEDSRGTVMSGFNLVGSYGLFIGFAFSGIVSNAFGYMAAFATGGLLEIFSAAVAVTAAKWAMSPRHAVEARRPAAGESTAAITQTTPPAAPLAERTP